MPSKDNESPADEFDIRKPAPDQAKEAASNSSAAGTTPAPPAKNPPPAKPAPPPPNIPKENAPVAAKQEKETVYPLPKTLADTHKLIVQLAKLPERTAKEEEAKNKRLNRVKAHFAKLQQGLPKIALTADDFARVGAKHAPKIADYRMRQKARNDPDYADLVKASDKVVSEYDKLLKENEQLKTQLAAR